VWQDSGQVGKEALVNSQESFGADGLEQAVKYALVQVTSLVVHASHDGVWMEG
jgi:hypothetical protein